MARLISAAVVLLLAVVSISSAAAGSEFDKENVIRSVTDRVGSFEDNLLQVLGRTRDALHFVRFARRHEKRYETVEEIHRRFKIFSESLDLIRSTNRKGLSYKLGINRYADLSWEEFKATRLGAAQNCSATLRGNHKMTNEALLETKDWREDGIVSPVKDQGKCGSCWTFSTTGALEAAYIQATGKSISLSEQQLVDCATAFNNFGCNGGLPSQAFEYIKYNGGLDTEQSYPYAAVNGICNFRPENVGVKVLDSVNITLGAEDELKHAVGLVRPVSVAFEVVNGFRLYKSGVYSSDTCGSDPMDVNHAVLAVGYGVENGVPYWLIKNSWGAEWGDNGYFKMELGKNMCGVATCASYPIVAP
ncbi:oryzain gamma chain-like [Asparagus officinalis]|uniref:oryzain gamma chain-like n=1 Tax=Asparagus officinalis TaxID=4686 RepID=UPI00098E2597|nr:oryzain gamma chain-like [Asparagus officinalis]